MHQLPGRAKDGVLRWRRCAPSMCGQQPRVSSAVQNSKRIADAILTSLSLTIGKEGRKIVRGVGSVVSTE